MKKVIIRRGDTDEDTSRWYIIHHGYGPWGPKHAGTEKGFASEKEARDFASGNGLEVIERGACSPVFAYG